MWFFFYRQQRRFLVIDEAQFILVEPDTTKLGWGVVKFVARLQVTGLSSLLILAVHSLFISFTLLGIQALNDFTLVRFGNLLSALTQVSTICDIRTVPSSLLTHNTSYSLPNQVANYLFFIKITVILRVLSLVDRCVYMRGCKHGCDDLELRVFLTTILRKAEEYFFCVYIVSAKYWRLEEFSNSQTRDAVEFSDPRSFVLR